MADMFSLKGRVALVTGASRGLGFAMAKALADNGATVLINGRDTKTLGEAAEKCGALPCVFDVSDAKASRAAVDTIAKDHGRLDILVNNAGIQHRRPLTEWEDEDFERVIAMSQGKILLDGKANEVLGQEEVLATTYVDPPQLTRLGKRLGFKETVRNEEEFLSVLTK